MNSCILTLSISVQAYYLKESSNEFKLAFILRINDIVEDNEYSYRNVTSTKKNSCTNKQQN